MEKRKAKGIGLLSGGLDSILAVKILQDQDVDLICVTYVTPFFGPQAGIAAGRLAGVEVQPIDITREHLEMLKHPRYGYGSQMNPCIDCHALMLREAGKLMEREGADFLFTGEVLGQRPMSQRRDSLRSVEKLSGYQGRILRPMSARLLPPTMVEEEGLVDRERLLDIHGRSRKRQMELAAHYGIEDYPQPGGGCVLTKEGFANKLRRLFLHYPEAGAREIEILKWGRHFLLPGSSLFAVGRRQMDNQRLESLAGPRDFLLHVADYPGPAGVLLAPPDPEADLAAAARLLIAYSDAPADSQVKVEWTRGGESGVFHESDPGRDYLQDRLIQ
ncbi:MAG: tRNA 4-thiouridine(8) synthase ThiI [Syntrophobacteraceae bacterium]